MNYERIEGILSKYGIIVNRVANIEVYAKNVLDKIQKMGDPLSESDHIELFDIFWSVSEAKKQGIELEKEVKTELVKKRWHIYFRAYERIVIGKFMPDVIDVIYANCDLTTVSEKQIWEVFHLVNPKVSNRTCFEINEILGLYRVLYTRLSIFHKIRVLDIGCGSQGTGIRTLSNKKIYRMLVEGYGIDIDIDKNLKDSRIKESRIENLPFSKDYFDFIYSCKTFCYNKREAMGGILSEALRVLKPKGILIFDDQDKNYTFYKELVKKDLILKYPKIICKPGKKRNVLIIRK